MPRTETESIQSLLEAAGQVIERAGNHREYQADVEVLRNALNRLQCELRQLHAPRGSFTDHERTTQLHRLTHSAQDLRRRVECLATTIRETRPPSRTRP